MKKSILILAATFLIGATLTSCKKEKTIEPDKIETSKIETVQVPFTGVVFQHRNDSVSEYRYSVISITNSSWYLPISGTIEGTSYNSYDSIPINFTAGDSIAISGRINYSDSFEETTTNPHVKVRTKVYVNGTLRKDTTSVNGMYWLQLP